MALEVESGSLTGLSVAARDSDAMIKICLSMLAGAYALHFTSFATSSDLVIAALFTAGLVALIGGRTSAAIFLAGLTLFLWQSQRVIDDRLDSRFEGDSMRTVVRVAGFPESSGDSIRFVVKPIADTRLPGRVRLSWYAAPQVPQVGDIWQLEVRLRRPRGTRNPGVFDYETWLFRERIGATGYVVNGKRNRLLQRDGGDAIERLRSRQSDRLVTTLRDRDVAAVMAAITVGTRHLLSDDQWTLFAATGTTHLMAISGLHVGLAGTSACFLAMLVCALTRRPGNHVRVGLVTGWLIAIAYSAVSGFAVPAQRATLMLSLAALVLLRYGQIRPYNVLACACVLLLAVDPLVTMMPGFQLSLLAVAVLLWWASRRSPRSGSRRTQRVVVALGRLASMQLGLLFGLLPITAIAFQRVSLVAPAVNLFAVPLFSMITVPFSLTGLILAGPLSIPGDMALRTAAASIGLLNQLLVVAGELPFASLALARITALAWLSLAIAAAWAVLPPGWPGRYVAWLALAALVSHRIDGPGEGCVDLRMLDVGQGLAVVLRTSDRTLLYDTGPAAPGGTSTAKRVVIPYLKSEGVRRLDRVIVSHSDIDHSGGVGDILDSFQVGTVLAGEPLRLLPDGSELCSRGARWRWGAIRFEILHPPTNHNDAGNDSSCVLRVSIGDRRILFTGDISARTERSLLREGVNAPADIVIAPHHGSDTSSTQPFVDALRPEVVLVSAGHLNRWDLPRPQIVSRWKNAGSVVLTTSVHGAIGVRLCDAGGIEWLQTYRQRKDRLWHASRAE